MSGILLPWVNGQFTDDLGAPLSGGSVDFYITGTLTRKNTYVEAALVTPNSNPVDLDAAGRATIFLASGGYDLVIKDSLGVTIRTVENVIDLAQTAGAVSPFSTEGAKGVVHNYQMLTTDFLVTVQSTGLTPCDVYLPDASGRTAPLCVKNVGTEIVTVKAGAGETIDAAASRALPVASGSISPSFLLIPDNVSAWWIYAAL